MRQSLRNNVDHINPVGGIQLQLYSADGYSDGHFEHSGGAVPLSLSLAQGHFHWVKRGIYLDLWAMHFPTKHKCEVEVFE